ncbi:MAG: DEAD/DEAH box helicase [Alphaproteobacteria bacterium]|nr:DEAD/DEAH box helicase [Alphaproteobacteria bacterium]
MISSETTTGAEAGTVEVTHSDTSTNSSPAEVEFKISEASPAPVKEPEVAGFDSLGLSPEVLKAVAESGYTTPTPIQAQGIPHVLQRKDIIGIAQTGTGKTASFTLPMIELLARGRAKARMPRSLILEPTRELAAQVAENFEKYGKFNKLSMALLIGGVSFDDQEKKLDRGVDVLIATPGRLLDHFERGKLMLSQVQLLVIDEADRMLDMGFIPDVERICKLVPFTRQTLFYSATMPPEIQRLTEQFLHNPVRVEVTRPATAASTITQELIDVPANDWAKREALRRLIRESSDVKNAIVFCNRKRDVDIVAKSLSKHGFSVAPLHGDLDQSVRMKTLDAFKANDIQILVASDVAARGLDIPAVSHVFNFDVPIHSDDYVHRIGRTGRAGRSGFAYMLATSRDDKYVDAIEKLTGKKLPHRVLEGLAESVQNRPKDDRPQRGGRDNRRDRGRDRNRERPVKDHGQRASMEPAQQTAAPVTQATAPQQEIQQTAPQQHRAPQREHKQDHKHDHRQDHRQPHNRQPQQQHAKPQHQQREHNKPKPPGTDALELPAFLMRPVKLPAEKAPAKKKTQTSEA